jgi:hypothetical protein
MFKRTTIFGQEMPGQPMFGWKRDVVILIVLQVALGLAYLRTVPRIYVDEVWDSSLGHSLAYTGALKHPFIEGFGGMHIHFVQPRIVLPLVCAAIFKVAGYSILTSRIGSLLFGVLAVVSLYAVMRRWFGEKQAIWIAVATILHPWFFEVSRRARPEIYYIALAMTALWCVVCSLDSNSRRTALLAGTLAALAALAHPSGFILDFAIAGAVLIWLRNRTIWRLVLWACFGFVVAILPYIIYVFWAIQDPAVNFFEQMHSGWGQRGTMLAGEISRWKNFLQWPKGAPLLVILVASWLLAWYRSTSADKILATIVGLFSLVLPFVSTNTAGRYLVALTPLFCALMVRLVCRIIGSRGLLPQNWYKLGLVLSASVVVIYVSMCITAISIMFYRLRGADFTMVIDRVASVVGREYRVYGAGIFWMGHDRYRYGPFPVDSSVIPFRQTIDMVRKHHFDYAVRSAWLFSSSHGVASPPVDMPDFRPSYTLDQVCKRFGTKIDEFRDPYFGPVETYRLNWDNDSDSESKK